MNWDAIIFIGLKLLAVLGLVLMNGFFVMTEFALVKVRQTQLEPFANRGQRRAVLALHLTRHLDAYLSACQLGITLASLGLGWIGEPIFADLLAPVYGWLGIDDPANAKLRHSISFGVGFSVITFLHIVAGEMAPKSLAIRLPLRVSVWAAHPMHWFYLVMYPFIWVLNESSLLLLRCFGLEPAHEGEAGASSEEELRLLLASSQEHIGASQFSRDMVLNALALRHRTVREVMRPRQEIAAFNTEAELRECLELAEKSRYSRFPLCEQGDLDRTLGVVHIKDLFAMRLKARLGADLLPVAKKLIYVPETARVEKLLQLLLERKLHMAVVVDEYGGTVGLLTLENILEELVGQIQDEFDQEKPLLVRLGEQTWEVAGALPLHDLEAIVGESLAVGGSATASGLVTQRLGGFPKVGDRLEIGPCELRVEELDGLRVSRLKITRKAASVEKAAGI